MMNITREFPDTTKINFGPFINYKNGELELSYEDRNGNWHRIMFYDVMGFSMIDSCDPSVVEFDIKSQYSIVKSGGLQKYILGFDDNGGCYVCIECRNYKILNIKS